MKHLFLSIATLLVLTNTSFAQEMLIRIPQHTFEHLGIKTVPQTTFISERKYEVLDGEPNLFSVRHYQLDLAKQHVNSITDTIYTETGRRIKHHQFEYSGAGQLIHYTAEGDYELTITYTGTLISKVEKKALSNDQTSWVNEHAYDGDNITSTSIKNLETRRTFKATYVKSKSESIKSDDGTYSWETVYEQNGKKGIITIKENSKVLITSFNYASTDYLPLIEPQVLNKDDGATDIRTTYASGGSTDWTGKVESSHSDLLGELHNYYITRAYYSSNGKVLFGETTLTAETRKRFSNDNPAAPSNTSVAYYQKLENSIAFEIMGNIGKHVIKGSIAPNGLDVILYEPSLQATYLLESFMSPRKANEKWYKAKFLALGTDLFLIKKAQAFFLVKEGLIQSEAKGLQLATDLVYYVPELNSTYSVKNFQKMEDNLAYPTIKEESKSPQFYVLGPKQRIDFFDSGNPIVGKLAALPNKDVLLYAESNNTSYLLKNFATVKQGEYNNAEIISKSDHTYAYKQASTGSWFIFLKGENLVADINFSPANNKNLTIKLPSGEQYELQNHESQPTDKLIPLK